MTPNEIFAKRLRNARIMKGFSMDDLVHEMGSNISKMSISKYEKGSLAPNSTVVISLSKALDQPVDYFFSPFTVHVDSVKFRKFKSKLGAKQEAGIKEQISDLIERYVAVEEICGKTVQFQHVFQNPVFSEEDVKAAALELRRIWKIGDDGIVNVIALLEEKGFKVLEIDAPASFDGLSSMVNDKYPVIVLNKNFCMERKRFTALHELGHIMLPFATSVSDKEQEALCNLFANEMLILENVFKNIFGQKRHDISYQELRSIQTQYGISCDAMMYKAMNCGIISGQRYKTYCIQKSKSPEFKKMVETSLYPKEESTRFVRLVYGALSNELITISKAASFLRQSVEQVRNDLVLV